MSTRKVYSPAVTYKPTPTPTPKSTPIQVAKSTPTPTPTPKPTPTPSYVSAAAAPAYSSTYTPSKNAVAGGTITTPGGSVTFTTMSYELKPSKIEALGINAVISTNGGTKIEAKVADVNAGISGSFKRDKIAVSIGAEASLGSIAVSKSFNIGPVTVEVGGKGTLASIGAKASGEISNKGFKLNGFVGYGFGIGGTFNIKW
jgi:hypothetical protein